MLLSLDCHARLECCIIICHITCRGDTCYHVCATWVSQIIGAVPGIQHGESRVTTVGPYSPNVAMSINYNINCHTDGSKLDDNRTGVGVLIDYSHIESAEEAIHLGNSATVFQAEVFAVGRTASHLIFAETNNKSVVINCDSQAAIMSLNNTKIKSKTTLDAVLALNKLGENNQVLIRWIPAHSGYLGNEKADSLAKRGANNTDATLLKLPIPKVTWDMAIRERTKHNIWTKWRDAPPSHFTRVWRKKFSKSIHNLNRGNLRKATMLLTGHVTVNYHLNKYKPDKISKTCPPLPCSGGNDQSLHWTVSEMVGSEECSLQLILAEHIRSGRRLLHFCYHEVHQRDRASKPHHRVARLAPGQADSPLHHQLDHAL